MNTNKEYMLNESKNFCMAPWIHMHVWPNGRAFPCCLSDPALGDYGNTNRNTISELWNSDLACTLRKNMLQDKPTETCKRCYELESDADAYTLRRNLNYKFKHHYDKVHETDPDGSHNNPNLAYMDFRFSNLCNMKCRTCSPTFSTMWYDDYMKKFGHVREDIATKKFLQLKEKPGFLEELWPLLDTVEEVYWAGGEPLITDVHWDIMNHWVETGQSENITINYTTNFSQLFYKRQNVIDLWKKFKNVNVAASLDASHGRAEYIRDGTVWSDIVNNRKQLLEQAPEVDFTITPTISLMNIWHLPDFHLEWLRMGYVKPNGFRLNNLLDPKYFCMQVLPSSYKEELTEKWENYIDYVIKHPDFKACNDQYWETSARGTIEFLNKQDLSYLLPETLKEWETWDEVRNQKWYEAMPELKFLEMFKE
jgi:hypothetical protein